MIALLVGLASGFVISMPPGPVAAFTIETTLSKGKRTGMSVGLGVAFIDTLFCLGILFASSAIIGWFLDLAAAYPTASLVLRVLVIIAIFVYAVLQFRAGPEVKDHSRVHLEQKIHSTTPIIIGAATAMSNAFNPTFLPSLTALLASISSQVPQVHENLLDKWLFALGFGAGTYGWLHVIISMVHRHHALVSPHTMIIIRRVGALIFIGFALFLAWKMIEQI